MAEPNAALPTNQSANLVNNLTALLQTLGGTKTTTSTNPGDTAALQNVLGQLQGADYCLDFTEILLHKMLINRTLHEPGKRQECCRSGNADEGGNTQRQ